MSCSVMTARSSASKPCSRPQHREPRDVRAERGGIREALDLHQRPDAVILQHETEAFPRALAIACDDGLAAGLRREMGLYRVEDRPVARRAFGGEIAALLGAGIDARYRTPARGTA